MLAVRTLLALLLLVGGAAADEGAGAPAAAEPAAASSDSTTAKPDNKGTDSGARPALTAAPLDRPAVPPPPPPQKHRALRIGVGLATGAVLIGGIIALGVALAGHDDSKGYNDWGSLTVMRR